MTTFRAFHNDDPPSLALLWNRGVPELGTARPLSAHEFDAHVLGRPHFDRNGLIVAERDGSVVGFVHAGFGPDTPVGAPWHVSTELGTVGMLVVAPGHDDPELEDGLLSAAERYLAARGASVVYAGGMPPLNPYYWGVYGGSEWAGVLGAHTSFHRAVNRAGYEPVSTCVLLEADLTAPEPRDVRGVLIRRLTRLEVEDDPMPADWWEAVSLGDFHTTTYRLLSKPGDVELARASTWDMAWFGRLDGRQRLGLIDMEVGVNFRRKGYGRHLVNEILRAARGRGVAVASIQTNATNVAALALYESVGFEPVESTTLYRRPGGRV